MASLKRVRAVAMKEMQHILRDPRTLTILVLMPLLQLIIFGYALNMELRQVPIVIVDKAMNPESRRVTESFDNTRYFSQKQVPGAELDPEAVLRSSQAQAVLIIDKDFGRTERKLLLLVDASDPNNAQLIQAYAQGIVQSLASTASAPIRLIPLVMFNPDLKSAYFFVPGLIAMILVMICALLTSISITREKELGTLEQILVSPVSAIEILLGKILPYIFLALLDGFLILMVGMLLFHVPFLGNALIFLAFTFLYVVTALCLGLLISTVAKTQQAAMMMAMAATLLPTLMLSGFMFPIASMPLILQKLTYIVPAKYFLQIIRGIMLKGNGISELWSAGLSLAGMSFFILVLAVKRFSLRLK